MWPLAGLGFLVPSSVLLPVHRKLLSWAGSPSASPGFLKCPRKEVTGAGCVVGAYNSYGVIPDKACMPNCPMAVLSGGEVCTVTAQCVLGFSFWDLRGSTVCVHACPGHSLWPVYLETVATSAFIGLCTFRGQDCSFHLLNLWLHFQC